VEQEESTHNIRIDGIKMRNQTEAADETETITGTRDDFPPLTPLTDEEQEMIRPPHVRKKKQQTDVELIAERRESRSTWNRKLLV
jgi:hypothetical protein